ncbi:MAG: hypothetical protein ACSLE8_21110 [Rhodococcus sp. (in: high G+C Gram-positive bacteria)]
MAEISRRRSAHRADAVLLQPIGKPNALAKGAPPNNYQLSQRMERRSRELLVAVGTLDTSLDPRANAEIMKLIRDDYDARQGGALIGLFGRCYLGPPYVDHKLDIYGNICQHYTASDTVEMPYNNARALVRNDAYAFVELYSDGSIVPVRDDGEPVRTGSTFQ